MTAHLLAQLDWFEVARLLGGRIVDVNGSSATVRVHLPRGAERTVRIVDNAGEVNLVEERTRHLASVVLPATEWSGDDGLSREDEAARVIGSALKGGWK